MKVVPLYSVFLLFSCRGAQWNLMMLNHEICLGAVKLPFSHTPRNRWASYRCQTEARLLSSCCCVIAIKDTVCDLSLCPKRMEHVSEERFPLNAEDYKLYEEVGEGVSATVYRALCIPLNKEVGIKVLDLEKCHNDLDGIRREVQTMTLTNHPNVLRSHCSFTTGHNLWVVMPYMSGGSCLHIMKSSYPEGFEEPIIATLLQEVLKALVYLHAQGHIHRDVKAGNILIDFNGAIKLADFGVSACMFDTGDRQRSRNTFVGTPCWMAPEVMQQLHGYDFKADIWSFGITALELAHGHAPFSKYPPMKVLLMTLQNAPPGLDYERDKRFSKSFKEMVATCLVKDPKKRPSSEKLLKHQFFKHARSTEYLSQTILDGLAPLGDRFRMLKTKEADLLVRNKALYEDKEQLSQKEYIRGISAWNFNLEDLKSQAALIEDDGMPDAEEPDMDTKQKEKSDDIGIPAEGPSSVADDHADTAPILGKEDGFNDVQDLGSSLASFPIKPLQELKGYHLDVCENSVNNAGLGDSDQEDGRNDNDISGTSSSLPQNAIAEHIKLSGYLLPDGSLYSKKITTDDASEAFVQRKGRFKITSADLSPKGPLSCTFGPVCRGLSSPPEQNLTSASFLAPLYCILQQNIMQREEIIKLIKCADQSCGRNIEPVEAGTVDLSQISPRTTRERELHSQVIQLQQSIESLVEELQRQKIKNSQLEKQLNFAGN